MKRKGPCGRSENDGRVRSVLFTEGRTRERGVDEHELGKRVPGAVLFEKKVGQERPGGNKRVQKFQPRITTGLYEIDGKLGDEVVIEKADKAEIVRNGVLLARDALQRSPCNIPVVPWSLRILKDAREEENVVPKPAEDARLRKDSEPGYDSAGPRSKCGVGRRRAVEERKEKFLGMFLLQGA